MASTVSVNIVGDATQLRSALGQAEGSLSAFDKKMQSVGASMVSAGKTMSVAVTLPLLAVGVASFKAASDLNESMSKVSVVFEDSAKAIKDWAKDSAQSLGMSRQAALEAAGTYGNFFRALGVGIPEAAKMSKSLVQLAADLASFNNASPEEVLLALRSGLAGEAEPLRKFGVSLSAARVEAEGMALGINKSYQEMTAAEKATISYQVILKDTALAQGDFARTADGAANQQRIMKAELQNAAATMGQILLPIITKVVGFVGELGHAFAALPDEAKEVVTVFAAIAATAGPLLFVTGKLIGAWPDLVKGFDAIVSIGPKVYGAFLQMASAISAMTLAQGLAVVGVGLAVAAVVGLAVVLSSGKGKYEEATEAAEKWARASINSAKATGDEYKNLKSTYDILATRIKDLREAASADDAERRKQGQTTQDINAAQQQYADSILILQTRHDALTPAIKRLRQAQIEAKAADEGRRNAIDAVTLKTVDYKNATDDVTNAIKGYHDTILGLADAEAGYKQALNDQTEAYGELLKAIHDHGIGSDEAAEADRRFQDAQRNTMRASSDLQAQIESYQKVVLDPTAYSAEVARLSYLRDKYPELAAQYQAQIDKLQTIHYELVTLPANTFAAVWVTGDAARQLQEIQAALGNIGMGGYATFTAPTGGYAGAEGAIVSQPTLALIGEAGPEMLVPLSHAPGASALPGGGGTVTINVNVAPGADLAEAGRQMASALSAYERGSGTSWRN